MSTRTVWVAFLVVAGLAGPAAAAASDGPIIPVAVTASSETKGYAAARSLWRSYTRMEGGAWCASKADATGETLTFAFGAPRVVTKIQLTAGSYGAYPSKLQVTAGKQKTTADVGMVADRVTVDLDGSPVDSITITIAAVGSPGKVGEMCLNDVRFQTATADEFYRPIAGVDQAGLDALADFGAGLDAAFKACDATVLGTAVTYPLVHAHFVHLDDGDVKEKKTKYKTAKQLVAACKKKGSFLKLGFGSGEVSEGKDLAHPRSTDSGEVLLGYYPPSDYNYAWFVRWKDGKWTLASLATVK
jgi:hypothetical protein